MKVWELANACSHQALISLTYRLRAMQCEVHALAYQSGPAGALNRLPYMKAVSQRPGIWGAAPAAARESPPNAFGAPTQARGAACEAQCRHPSGPRFVAYLCQNALHRTGTVTRAEATPLSEFADAIFITVIASRQGTSWTMMAARYTQAVNGRERSAHACLDHVSPTRSL